MTVVYGHMVVFSFEVVMMEVYGTLVVLFVVRVFVISEVTILVDGLQVEVTVFPTEVESLVVGEQVFEVW